MTAEFYVAAGALVWSIYETIERRRISRILRTITTTYAGNIAQIYQKGRWGWMNARSAHDATTKLPDSTDKNQAQKFISDTIGDTASIKNMASNMFNDLLGFQQAAFKTRNVSHPQQHELDLIQSELEQQRQNPKKKKFDLFRRSGNA
jgi:hypothetical protein